MQFINRAYDGLYFDVLTVIDRLLHEEPDEFLSALEIKLVQAAVYLLCEIDYSGFLVSGDVP
jgi:hypothetical protein